MHGLFIPESRSCQCYVMMIMIMVDDDDDALSCSPMLDVEQALVGYIRRKETKGKGFVKYAMPCRAVSCSCLCSVL